MIEITDAMRRAVPAPCYQCDECMECDSDCTCYPPDMMGGYIEGKGIWVCSLCIDENEVDLLGMHWDDNDEQVYEHELTWPVDKLPKPYYVCAWKECGENVTFPATELGFISDVAAHPQPAGFYCEIHWDEIAYRLNSQCLAIPEWASPTLAEVLAIMEGEK